MKALAVVPLVLAPAAAARAYEEPRYEVVATHDGFEIRRYAPYVAAETEVRGGFEQARNEAFRRLFAYISGQNGAREEISMTAPVTTASGEGRKIAMTVPVTSAPGSGDGYVIQLMVPSKYTIDTAPQPRDPAVRLRVVGERWVAARRYSGRSNEANYRKHEAELVARVREAGYSTAGAPCLAVYNGPFTPWFMRRNEVLLPVEPKRT